jgi:hypothetical protein
MNLGVPSWLTTGDGTPPELGWSFETIKELVCMDHARESGEIVVGDAAGTIYRLDRWGTVLSVTRGLRDLNALSWSDTGETGAVLFGEAQFCLFKSDMKLDWSIDLPQDGLDIAIDPFGRYIAVSLSDGETLIFNAHKKRVGRYETLRPLRYLEFRVTEPAVLGVADYGSICCHDLKGNELWHGPILSNIGDISAAGSGDLIFLAAYNHGVQAYDGDGNHHASYIVDGTVNHVGTSFIGHRIAASTIERHLYWINGDGKTVWTTTVDEDVRSILCDPLGKWLICGFASGAIHRLNF